ncbi:MAG TPA: MopE-related protein [Kofleriaceae bacterium]|jgi:hypothetical protein
MKALTLAALTILAGCDLNPYDLGHHGGADDDGGVGDDGGGSGDDGGGSNGDGGGPTCNPIGVDDQCNEIDDDCDGVVDQTFDKTTDPNNCGICNHRCVGLGAIQKCDNGACAFDSCQPGFADLDNDPLTCEYQCPLFPTIAEDCNGVDDDCDGKIDEDLPAPPVGQCRTTPNTPCANTTMTCATRGGQTHWFCDYSADVEFDPSVPNGIVLQEQLCNGKDGDCDGVVDDSFTDLNQQCDDGKFGICRDVGKRICDPVTPTQTKCDLTVLPDAQPSTAETCNGLDDNCDGMVDNPVAGHAFGSMTEVLIGTAHFWMDTFEASHPDATMMTGGVSTTLACSNAGVVPWRGATYAGAVAACAAAGKVLCTGDQWGTACQGATPTPPPANPLIYPYGMAFDGNACNTETYDGDSNTMGNQNVVTLTGSLATCQSTATGALGIYDLSGNLKEWTDEDTGNANIKIQRGGSYLTPSTAATCQFKLTRSAVGAIEQETGFRCCRPTAP